MYSPHISCRLHGRVFRTFLFRLPRARGPSLGPQAAAAKGRLSRAPATTAPAPSQALNVIKGRLMGINRFMLLT